MDHHNESDSSAALAFARLWTGCQVNRLGRPRFVPLMGGRWLSYAASQEDSKEWLPLPRPEEGACSRPLVLIADYDDLVRRLMETVLRLTGFETVLAATGREALIRFLRHPRAIRVALLDVGLPGWSGPQTLTALRRFDPGLLCCFMTGKSSPYTEADLLTAGADCVFWKPLAVGQVATTLRRLTGPARPSA